MSSERGFLDHRPRLLVAILVALFVITDFKEFTAHHLDLQQYLASHCVLSAGTPDYRIYRDCASEIQAARD